MSTKTNKTVADFLTIKNKSVRIEIDN